MGRSEVAEHVHEWGGPAHRRFCLFIDCEAEVETDPGELFAGEAAAVEAVRAAADARMGQAVRTARSLGLSWTEIGRATGVSRQLARKRWGRFDG